MAIARLTGAALAFVAAIVALLATTPPRADIGDCFSAVAPLEQGVKAAEITSKAAVCAGVATSDPVMALTILGLTAAAAADQFPTSDQCKDKIDGTVGRLVAKALTQLPGLPSDAKKLLLDFAHGYLPISLTDILAMTGLGFVAGYIECGCLVADAAGDLKGSAHAASVTDSRGVAKNAIKCMVHGWGSAGRPADRILRRAARRRRAGRRTQLRSSSPSDRSSRSSRRNGFCPGADPAGTNPVHDHGRGSNRVGRHLHCGTADNVVRRHGTGTWPHKPAVDRSRNS